jgi:hypothetical protein
VLWSKGSDQVDVIQISQCIDGVHQVLGKGCRMGQQRNTTPP